MIPSQALQELLEELRNRDGGLMLQEDGVNKAVVLNLERYEQLLKSTLPQHKGTVTVSSLTASLSHAKQKYALITGSAGLIGSESAKFFAERGYKIIGIDNNMREYFLDPKPVLLGTGKT